jgi:hypothetical protein
LPIREEESLIVFFGHPFCWFKSFFGKTPTFDPDLLSINGCGGIFSGVRLIFFPCASRSHCRFVTISGKGLWYSRRSWAGTPFTGTGSCVQQIEMSTFKVWKLLHMKLYFGTTNMKGMKYKNSYRTTDTGTKNQDSMFIPLQNLFEYQKNKIRGGSLQRTYY